MLPVLVQIGSWGLPTYGVLTAAGYLSAVLWLKTKAAALRLDDDRFWSLVYAVFFGALAGGKILYWLVESPRILAGDWSPLTDLRYGFVFYGGFAGAVLAGVWKARRLGVKVGAACDAFAAALPLGHAVGRLGCLASGCCYGRPSRLPWALALGGHPASATPAHLWGVALHPVQLYEAAGNAALFGALAFWALPRAEAGRLRRGSVFWAYAAGYGLLRFILEFWRGDDRGIGVGPASVSQAGALLCVAGALYWFLRPARRGR